MIGMVTFQTDNICPICEEKLVLNVNLDVKVGAGICNECGLPHKYRPKVRSEEGIESVSPMFDSDFIDWEVIEEYYDATGNMATTVAFCEATEEQIEMFEDWANEEFDMLWGVNPEEINGLE
jgi:transcription elongation factor Elf1